MDEDSIGFSAKAPVSTWNKRIGVDYPGVFKALLKASLAVATANGPGVVSSAIDGLFAFKMENRKLSEAELSWLLIRRALAKARAPLTVGAVTRRRLTLDDRDNLVAGLDEGLGDAEIWIGPDFFDRPAEHSVVEAIAKPFGKWLQSLGLGDPEVHSLQTRLGPYFTFALRREWAGHFDIYVPIDLAANQWDTPFGKADARARAWMRNAAFLQQQLNEPVFGELFGLCETYVPLRGWYAEAPEASRARGPADGDEKRIVVDLVAHLDDWFARRDRKDPIRVLCGGPGSGKTSVAKTWSAKLADEGHRVLFIPLHRLILRSEHPDMQTVLSEFVSDRRILPGDPLDARDGENELLIVLDGLDELAMQGRAGRELARNFVNDVEQRIRNWNEPGHGHDGRLIRVLFGGRDIAVEATRLSGRQILHVLPYHGTDAERFADPNKLLDDERFACKSWWQRFGAATGASFDDLPEPLQREELVEITGLPLLNHLLALSYRRAKLDFASTPSLNRIYEDLLGEVYERRWGPGEHPAKQHLTLDEYRNLLDELGACPRNRKRLDESGEA